LTPATANEAGYDASNTASPQGYVMAPLLFNVHISDLLITVCRKYAYADESMHILTTTMRVDGDWQAVEGVLS